MPETPSSFKRGLDPEAALRRWSDQTAYQSLVALAGQADLPLEEEADECIRDFESRKKYQKERRALELAFMQELINGSIIGSGIPKHGRSRELIDPSLWEVLEIGFGWHADAGGDDRHYEKLEFFAPNEIPQNVARAQPVVPTSSEIGPPFKTDSDFQHLSVRVDFTLGPLQAKIVELLNAALLKGKPWQNGKAILEQAGSEQIKMGDVFKTQDNWNVLIESDGKGMYRLRLPSFKT